jgi:hypothetical protein
VSIFLSSTVLTIFKFETIQTIALDINIKSNHQIENQKICHHLLCLQSSHKDVIIKYHQYTKDKTANEVAK